MAETSTTTYMLLTLPTPGERLGPTWASDLNTALTAIDSHDHSSNKGAQIGIAGITIDGAFDFEKSATSYAALNMKYLSLKKTLTPSTSFPATSTTYQGVLINGETDGDLFWNDANNNQIQITDGGIVNVSGVAVNKIALSATVTSTNSLSVTETNNKSLYMINYAGTVAVTIPQIGTGSTQSQDGRLYIFKDTSGAAGTSTKNITITCNVADTIDGVATYVISSDDGSVSLVASETYSRWNII
ncbi:MAG TPA: hypothetical protein DCS66_19355 [Flavobacteriaceae bacterium]|nr:hypothetical protein [Flavobacteriaceae bacterium]